MIFLLSTLWFIRTTKSILFWTYLWQLKEYHIGRFIDHFRTAKGKELLFSPLVIGKLLLFFGLFWYTGFSWALFLIYGAECANAGRGFFRGKLLRPVFTLKTIVLTALCIVIELIFLALAFRFFATFFLALLLLFDIAVPKIVSLIVLSFQPFAMLGKRRIIQKAMKKRAKLTSLKVIGITGSYGKTSTKEFLFAILQKKFKVVKTPEHRNSEVGVSQTILQDLQNDTEVFICEMGAYNKGGIKLLASIAQPQIAILTGANEQHLATFGSMDNLLSAEGGKELMATLSPDGYAIFNGNNHYTKELYNIIQQRKILCTSFLAIAGNDVHADIWVEDIKVEQERILFCVRTKGEEYADFEVCVLGGYNVENILLAVATAQVLGMSLPEIAEACKTITPDMGAMKLQRGINGLNIIDSTYSANPDGAIAALEYLKTWPGKKIIVMPCLIELGKASKEVHKRIGEKIAEVCDLAIITTKDRFEDIVEGARLRSASARQASEKVLFIENPSEIVEKLKSTTRASDVVLLEGRVPKELCNLLYVQP